MNDPLISWAIAGRVAARANAASKARTAVRSKYFFIDASLVFIMACHDLR
jgi:hypothetical protein